MGTIRNNLMSEQPNAGAGAEASFDSLVGKEQPAAIDNPGAPAGEQPTGEQPKPAEGQPGTPPEGETPPEGQKPAEGENPEGDLFWGKFKSPDDAKSSYDQAQTKIIEQGTKLNELTKLNEDNTKLLTAIDAALAKNPELAEQLKQALTAEGETQDDKPGDIDSLLDKKLEEREQQKQQKAERDKWVTEHPDFSENDGVLGHQILDLLEKQGIPVTATTLQMAYDHLTKDSKVADAAKKAAEDALKKEELAELDRKNGAGVGGGNNDAKATPAGEDIFGNLVGGTSNPNSLRP
jgi:hypothetical protein